LDYSSASKRLNQPPSQDERVVWSDPFYNRIINHPHLEMEDDRALEAPVGMCTGTFSLSLDMRASTRSPCDMMPRYVYLQLRSMRQRA
jgi:hypothetical protein